MPPQDPTPQPDATLRDPDATLRDLGEDELVRRLSTALARGARVHSAAGDDCAIADGPGGSARLVWTIDTMVEGNHFRWREGVDPACVGWKLAASNLSDLASKGARPWSAVVSIAAPSDARAALVERVYEGLAEGLAPLELGLLGGDTVRSDRWTLTLALVGLLDEGLQIAARRNAEPGMALYATGWPGESGGGLALLERLGRMPGDAGGARLAMRHLRPEARVAEGRALVESLPGPLAMMDISDGVARDAGRLAAESGTAITIEARGLRLSEDLQSAFGAGEALRLFLEGGEDYELLFATRAGEDRVRAALAESPVPVQRIGRVEEGSGLFVEDDSGRGPRTSSGFEHF